MLNPIPATTPQPCFRRGSSPKNLGYVKVTYKSITADRADEAWRALLSAGTFLERSPVIAEAMGVSEQTARLLRRLYDGLNLIEDLPGEWNPQKFTLGTFDQYAMDENYPASVRVLVPYPDALALALHPLESVTIYVASSAVPGAGLGRVADFSLPSLRSGRGPVRPASFWWSKGRVPHLPEFVSGECAKELLVEEGVATARDTNDQAPPSVVIVRTETSSRSEASNSPQPVRHEPLSIPDLMNLTGWSRSTVNRRLLEWHASGLARKVTRGRYLLLGRAANLVDAR